MTFVKFTAFVVFMRRSGQSFFGWRSECLKRLWDIGVGPLGRLQH